jgi:hypothetical protein
MERTDWLDTGFDSVDARFLMVTAITHHQFSSPIWGEDEVRKLHAELAEIELLASRAVMDHDAAAQPPPGYSGYQQCADAVPTATLASCAAC